jgi:hypothetical protein
MEDALAETREPGEVQDALAAKRSVKATLLPRRTGLPSPRPLRPLGSEYGLQWQGDSSASDLRNTEYKKAGGKGS